MKINQKLAALAVAVCVTIGALSGCPEGFNPTTTTEPTTATILFHNESEAVVLFVFVKDARVSPGWGPNRLGDEPLLPGESRAFDGIEPGPDNLVEMLIECDSEDWPGPISMSEGSISIAPGEVWEYWLYT